MAFLNQKMTQAAQGLQDDYDYFEKQLTLSQPFKGRPGCGMSFIGPEIHYWFHPDHLGSSSYISNDNGEISQHLEYLPFGETLVEEHKNSNNSPYKFNGKELDDETGNYYYGARYLNPKWSFWLSVDPLAEEYLGWSPYNYTMLNPVRLVDPDGRSPKDPPTKAGRYLHTISFYKFRAQDFERRNPGKKAPSYYMQYGDYNIKKFSYETNSRLTQKGQVWLIKARNNLQDAIEDGLSKRPDMELNDKIFTEFAMGTHVDAYWDAGLKDLHIVDLVNIGLTPDIKHLASSEGLDQIGKIGEKLLDHWTSNPSVGTKRLIEFGANAFKINVMINEYVQKQVHNGGGAFDEVYNETRAVLERLIPKFSDYIPTKRVE